MFGIPQKIRFITNNKDIFEERMLLKKSKNNKIFFFHLKREKIKY